jgi:hypothetical protein
MVVVERGEGRLRMTINLFKDLHETPTRDRILDQVPPIPDDTKTWLGRLTLLYGVPFQYLVPDERMLPAESLRFFYVDPLWMEALLDGALSIGRSQDVLTLLNKTMAGTYTKELIDEARKIRPVQQAGPDRTPTLAASPVEGSFQFSGFLLRSEIVAGWRGLTVRAYPTAKGREAGGALATLRLERLARDVLFGLFEGHLRSLEIIQPLESLHFREPAKLGFIDGERVLDVSGYWKSLNPSPDNDNSASFAVSLLAQPARYTFSIED